MGRADQTLERLRERRERHRKRHLAYRAVFTVAGFFVVAGGIVLSLPLVPGPGFVLIAIGLGMLALEFSWAERTLERALIGMDRSVKRLRRKRGPES